MSSYFNRYGIYTDGSVFSTGGVDGAGNAYSANLLGTSRVLSGELFDFGTANELDAVSCTGQPVLLPQGHFSTLTLLGAAVEGNQLSETLTVNYTDGSSATLTQSFSDWYTPEKYAGEQEAVAMAYRDVSNGTEDKRTFNLYAYYFAINSSKVVQGVTLPNNSNVVVLAATLH
jgi:hypothetical protein